MTKPYELTEGARDDHWSIKFTEGLYKGVELVYNDIRFEELDNGECVMNFGYDIIDNAGYSDDELKVNNEEFVQQVGDVLMYIIEDSIKHLETKNATADNDSTQPTA